MRPGDCQPHDRHRYFHNGFMLFNDEPVVVSVSHGGTFRANTRDGTQCNAPLRELYPFYPEARCINTFDTGVFIGRRARQVARRTASRQHYEVQWSPPRRSLTVDMTVLWDLCEEQEYPTYEEGFTLLKSRYSVAISPDIILARATRPVDCLVIYRDTPVGRVQAGVFVPEFENSCFTKLARMALQEIDAPCL